MNAAAFAQVMKNPGLLRNYSLSELQELAVQHPYASSVYSMVALKAHLEGDGNYEHYLNQAAIRIPDRKRLYHLIHSDYEYAFAGVLPLQGKEVVVEDDVETIVSETAKTEVVERVEEIAPPVKEKVQEESKVEDTKIEEEVQADEAINVQEELKTEEVQKTEEQPLIEAPQEQRQPAFDPEEELELSTEEAILNPEAAKEEEANDEKTLDLPGTDEVLTALNAIRSFKPDVPVDKPEDIVEEIRNTVTPKQKPAASAVAKDKNTHSFTEWLSLLKGEKPAKALPEEKEELQIEPPPFTLENQSSIVNHPSSIREQVELEDLPVETEEEKELDEIITARQAKASLAQDDELVTETLAQIYELQRKYDKAMKAYQTLSLKYPDKRAYFAEKIAKLKNK